MNFTSKHKLLIITIIILLILIIFSIILTKFGAFKNFQQDTKDNKCKLPPVPTNLRYKRPSHLNHQLKWNKTSNATHYKLYCYRENPFKGGLPFYTDDTSIHHNYLDSKEIPLLTLASLEPGNYWFRVRAINDCGEGEFSDPLSVTI